jgi:hypothetical protein
MNIKNNSPERETIARLLKPRVINELQELGAEENLGPVGRMYLRNAQRAQSQRHLAAQDITIKRLQRRYKRREMLRAWAGPLAPSAAVVAAFFIGGAIALAITLVRTYFHIR